MRLYERVVEFESTGVKYFRVNGENIHFVETTYDYDERGAASFLRQVLLNEKKMKSKFVDKADCPIPDEASLTSWRA